MQVQEKQKDMQKPMQQGAEIEAEELVKRAGSPSKIRFTGKSKI